MRATIAVLLIAIMHLVNLTNLAVAYDYLPSLQNAPQAVLLIVVASAGEGFSSADPAHHISQDLSSANSLENVDLCLPAVILPPERLMGFRPRGTFIPASDFALVAHEGNAWLRPPIHMAQRHAGYSMRGLIFSPRAAVDCA